MQVGVAGTGRMGTAIANRLMSRGHSLAVWNRSAPKAAPLVESGAALAPTASELARRCEFVITILTDARALADTYDGPVGLLAADVRGKLFIEMSTVRPESERALAERARAKGACFVECPVGGSVGPAREGKLFGFAGGEASDVERARAVLGELCRRIEHVGPVGAGASVKLAINLPLLVYYQALGEALALVRPLGLDPARLMDIFSDTSGAPAMLKIRAPALASQLAGKEVPPTVNVDTIRKDLRTMIEEAQSLGARLPLAEQALQCYDAASRAGLGASDCTRLPAHWAASPRP